MSPGGRRAGGAIRVEYQRSCAGAAFRREAAPAQRSRRRRFWVAAPYSNTRAIDSVAPNAHWCRSRPTSRLSDPFGLTRCHGDVTVEHQRRTLDAEVGLVGNRPLRFSRCVFLA